MSAPHKIPSSDDEAIIRGVVSRVTYRNAENGYSVLQVEVSKFGEKVAVVGNALDVGIGSNIVARGSFKEHPRFGKQFSALSITQVMPTTPEGIKNYLSSGLIKGIGPKTADRLVELLGPNALEIIQKEPTQLDKLKGLGKHKIGILKQAIKNQTESSESLKFLIESNISQALATKIYKMYGSRTIEIISANPFRLANEVQGIGFTTADSIAQKLGMKPDDPKRAKAGIVYALEKAADDGHCYLTPELLLQKARALLELGDECDLGEHLICLVNEGLLLQEDKAILLPHLGQAEKFVAKFVAGRVSPYEIPPIQANLVEQAISLGEKTLGLEFSFEQKETVKNAVNYPLLIITGGPGCGKTTIIKALSILYRLAGRRLLLAAPTGRAAQRMSEVCDMPASTIHRLLKFDPRNGRFIHGTDDPLIADAIIIDEASMIDIRLAKGLFAAIPSNCSLILVGDKDQLPSVGPGRVLADLLTVKEIKATSLSKLFRRSDESSINLLAHMINSGQTPEIPTPDGNVKSESYFIARKDAQEAAEMIERLVADQLPKKFGFSANDIVVLTPTNRGPLGTISLNQRLQNGLNPDSSYKPKAVISTLEFRLGDRVCQRVNNYDLGDNGVFNGDIGIIENITPLDGIVSVRMWDGRLVQYSRSDLFELSLAYAMSVHRSQGSEIPCVVLALHDSHFMLLEKQLLYTAVTRAKKLLVVVGSKRALHIACRRAMASKRLTKLPERIKDIINY